MIGGSMAWWYWFGMWVFGIAGLVVSWWMLLDSWRKKGSATRYLWPVVAIAGVVLQLPAFAMSDAQRAGSQGTIAAMVGVAGFVLTSVAAVTHFSRSPGGSGSTWSLRTRDSGSASSAGRDRRVPQRPVRASVPIAGPDAAQKHAPPAPSVGASTSPTGAFPRVAPTSPASHSASEPGGAVDSKQSSSDTTEVAEDAIPGQPKAPKVAAHASPGAESTITDGAVQTLIDDGEQTITESSDATITEDLGQTIVDEAEDVDSGSTEAELVITDGRTSRIIVTERSGPFLVGRDPSRCNLAIDDGRTSRTHFSVQLVDGEYVIEDLGSSNGTFLNGAMLRESAILQADDTIEFGRTVATFRLADKGVS